MNKKRFLIFFTIFLAVSMINFAFAGQVGGYSGKLSVSSGQGKIIISGKGQTPVHYCGNDILEVYLGEQCDGSNLNGESCVSWLGEDYSGSLSCHPAPSCTFDTSGCYNYYCGDGICNNGETCSSCSADCGSCPSTNTGGNTGGGGGGGSSGGSSGGITSISSPGCIENWECSEWSECIEEKQIRECNDIAGCNTELLKPAEERECVIVEEEGLFSRITGAAIGGGRARYTLPIIFVIIIFAGSIIIYLKRAGKILGEK